MPNWDADKVISVMETWGATRAFVRSQYKAAPIRLKEGSHILRPEIEEVDNTILSLLHQHETAGWKHGGSLVLREWIDLNFCMYPQHEYCHPECRFFIEDGDVIGAIPSLDSLQSSCQGMYDYLNPVIKSLVRPIDYAQTVANEFTEDTWAVDFVMDTSGEWYCIEMGLNAVRWDSQLRDWINHCDHGCLTDYGPREIHSAALCNIKTS